jgi:hypothetical protein
MLELKTEVFGLVSPEIALRVLGPVERPENAALVSIVRVPKQASGLPDVEEEPIAIVKFD